MSTVGWKDARACQRVDGGDRTDVKVFDELDEEV
jgi:hypothetical protein